MKKMIVGATLSAAMLLGSAAPVFAGEITGNGKDNGVRNHARSECAFSGLEDSQMAIDDPTNTKPGRLTQTPHYVYFDLVPGQEMFVNPPPGAPGRPGGCNPNTAG